MTMNEASAQTPTAAPTNVLAFAGNHQIKPLRFDPARLHGLSERLITSHHENNYAGSVKALNMIETRLAAALADTDLPPAFGSFDRWETDFRRTGMSLAGGSGWCVLVYNLHTRSLHNHWAWDHMHGAIAGVPLLALDMYEHSFHIDYGTAAAKYVDAFFRNIDWEVVDRRYAAALRGGG